MPEIRHIADDNVVEAVVEAQADLQVALGWLRLHIRTLDSVPMDDLERGALDAIGALEGVEEKSEAALVKLHALLKELGKEMA